MYAIVTTGSKQYRVSAGDFINVEKLEGKAGDKVELTAIFVSDGGKVVSDPAKAAATKVTAEIVEQFKDKKVIVFKFKKRKNYQRKVGHRQQLTRVKILSVGTAKAEGEKKTAAKPAAKKTATKETAAKATATKTAAKATETKPAAKKTATKTTTAKKTTAAKTTAEKKPAAKKTTTAAKKPAAKKTTTKEAKSE